jgi:TolB protein
MVKRVCLLALIVLLLALQGAFACAEDDDDLGHYVFVSDWEGNDEIYAVDGQGSAIRNLTSDQGQEREPALSWDGKRLAFSSDRDGNWEIYWREARSGRSRRVTRDGGTDGHPSWSPDGKKIAFHSNRTGVFRIYIASLETGDIEALPPAAGAGNHLHPAWSPLGTEIAFEVEEGDDRAVYVATANGENPRRVSADAMRPAWAPDGESLAILAGRDAMMQLHVVTSTGAVLKAIDLGDAFLDAPAWNSDGSRIFFAYRNSDEDFDIFSVRPDGSDLDGSIERPKSNETSPAWSRD